MESTQSQTVEQPVTTETPVSNKSHRTFFLVLASLLVLAALGSITYIVSNKSEVKQIPAQTTISPTPIVDPTANWKTYNCDSFLVKYPTGWYVEDGCGSLKSEASGSVGFLGGSQFKSYPYKNPGQDAYTLVNPDAPNGMIISVGVYSNPKNLEIEKFVRSNEGLNHRSEIWSWATEKVGDKTYFKEVVNGNEPFYYISDNKNRVYMISTFIFEKNNEVYSEMFKEELANYRTVFNSFLSAFKFTDQDFSNTQQLSSEGQSCGPNAGLAGDQECAAGLTCTYSTTQEKSDGIGTCVK